MKFNLHTGAFILGMAMGGTGAVAVGALEGCLPSQQTVKTVKDSIKLAEDACVIIKETAPDNKAGQEVCAREEELRPYIKLILGGRARSADAGSAK